VSFSYRRALAIGCAGSTLAASVILLGVGQASADGTGAALPAGSSTSSSVDAATAAAATTAPAASNTPAASTAPTTPSVTVSSPPATSAPAVASAPSASTAPSTSTSASVPAAPPSARAAVPLINLLTPTSVSVTDVGAPTAGGTTAGLATVTGVSQPTGLVTFSRFGPADPTCGGTPLSNTAASLDANAQAQSADAPVFRAGTYHWLASYAGDANNSPSVSSCAAGAFTVGKAGPQLITTPSASAAVGSAVTDTAAVRTGYLPTGSVTFRLFGPTDPTCAATPVGTRTASVSSSGRASSAGIATSAVGTYHWTARYSGDANNNAATSACASESVIVTKATAVLDPGSAAAVASSTSLTATATVAGFHPTGLVSFVFYEQGNTDCTGKRLSTQRVLLDANSTASAAPVSAPAAGVYAVRLRYVGDVNNRSTAATCTTVTVLASSLLASTGTSTTAPALWGAGLFLFGSLLVVGSRRRNNA
jgi:hypothetical protein